MVQNLAKKLIFFQIMPSLIPRTLIVIPSYFDFVRVRNHLKKAEESFVMCHEYATRAKVDRAREMFFHERKSYLVVTERWYFFNRRHLTVSFFEKFKKKSIYLCKISKFGWKTFKIWFFFRISEFFENVCFFKPKNMENSKTLQLFVLKIFFFTENWFFFWKLIVYY